MDLAWLQDIICLQNSQSFTKAAQERNITQSALSRRIKSLETWLDTALIDRASYPLRLTRAGEVFLPVARRMVAELGQTREELREGLFTSERPVRIAAPHSIASRYLARRLAGLDYADRGLRTRVFSDNAAICCDLFVEGHCDLLITYDHPAVELAIDPARFSVHHLSTVHLFPVAEREAVHRHGWGLPGTAEAPTPFLAYDHASFLGKVVGHILTMRREVGHFQTRHVDAFAEALKTMCVEGAGVAWLPEPLVRGEIDAGSLELLGDATWRGQMQLTMYSPRHHENRQVERLTAQLAAGAAQ